MSKPECSKCGCKRYRNVGEFACYPGPKPKVTKRVVLKRVIQCMRCHFVYEKKL